VPEILTKPASSMNPSLTPTKPHYIILDGLRGVAALVVVAFHILEAHATNHLDQIINHGYLAVDFFFLLSGFVVGYAYDDRWNTMATWEFFKRRLVRLQPMVVMGMIVGAALFYFQDSILWPNISEVPVWKMMMIMTIGFTLIPVPLSMDIRGWMEMYPLNGPGWSLFFEYLANILYAVWVRKFSNLALSVLIFVAGAALIHLAVASPAGDLIGGWSLDTTQFYIGLVRMMFPFFAGLLLSRSAKLRFVRHAFLLCSILVIVVLSMPRIGGSEHLWLNGLYDAFSIILVFPFIIYLGAGGEVKGKYAKRFCSFLGDISYPIYITHYPIIYIYTGWVHDHKFPISETFPIAILTFISSIALAYLSLKLYDEPVRKWLNKNVLLKRTVIVQQ
jgi:peptidoglycan/LPS O-acetylase OafA/YrhL